MHQTVGGKPTKRHAFLAAILALAAVAFVRIGAARTETLANPQSSFDGRPIIVEKIEPMPRAFGKRRER